ncbi:ABC transporter ATP-binding protein [Patulibacter minatonensis]|uniref:ABC transporter ATP-binding protein n=1 Tax=Patulibacter minatonensis TaxID=298163 RepID=UPI000A0692F7|nr:ABC transporter ATP-binding protein [Patulibacter minatonensis]
MSRTTPSTPTTSPQVVEIESGPTTGPPRPPVPPTGGTGGDRPGDDDHRPRRGTGDALDLKRIVRLFRPYRKRVGAVAGLIALSAVLGLAQPFLLRDVVDHALPDRDTSLLTILVAGMIGAAMVGAVLDVGQTWLSNTIGQRVMHDLRTSVYDHLQKMSLAFFTKTRSGEVQSRIANDIGGMQGVVTSTVTSFVSSFTTVAATLTAMIFLDWRLALATLIVVPFFVWLSRTVGKARRRIVTQRQKRLADMSAIVEESLSISGIVLTRTMGRSGDLVKRFAGSSDTVADLEVRSAMAGRWRMSTVQIAFATMPALVYWIAGYTSAHGGSFVTIGTLVAFTTLQTRLLMPMVTLLRLGVEIQTSLALFTRVFEYLDTPIDVVDPEKPVRLDPRTARGEVAFEHVSFSYDERSGKTLDDVDLTVPAGGTLAIVGETGSGKTTLGYLVARMYDVGEGRVTIDGVDVRDLSLDDRAGLVGVVAQETYLLHSSIAENLRFAKPDATDQELEDAARAAQIHDLIDRLPDGYDTVVGERGYRFSGGEKQRLAIARAMLRNPPVLILDEATSALDTRTEHAVQEALERLSENRTTIAIAHRLSTVRDADRIVVLDRGRIVEQGTHDDLLAAGGHYAALVERDREGQTLPA